MHRNQPSSSVARVLGIDPGTNKTGWALIEHRGSTIMGYELGVIAAAKNTLEHRLLQVHEELTRLIATYQPHSVAVEDIFFAKYPSAALKLGHVRGVALLAAAHADLPVVSYPPASVKRAIAGKGQAAKGQVAQLLCALLGMTELPPLDATDALAVAMTHSRALPQRALSLTPSYR